MRNEGDLQRRDISRGDGLVASLADFLDDPVELVREFGDDGLGVQRRAFLDQGFGEGDADVEEFVGRGDGHLRAGEDGRGTCELGNVGVAVRGGLVVGPDVDEDSMGPGELGHVALDVGGPFEARGWNLRSTGIDALE